MHIAVLSGGGVPNPHSGGGALTTYTVLRQALDSGHRVTAVALVDADYQDPTGAGVSGHVAHLRALGAEVAVVQSAAHVPLPDGLAERARRLLAPAPAELYPTIADAHAMRDAVETSRADVAFAYHWEPLAAARGLTVPLVAGVGDPSHLPRFYRWRDELPSRSALRASVRVQAAMRAYPRAMAALLEGCAAYGAFAAHHAEWFRRHGAPRCRYLHTPVPDDAGPLPAKAGRPRGAGEPARFLLLGHLKGIATIDGLRVFVRMLPELDRILGRGGYVVDVVGGYEPPPDVAAALRHPAVRRHGHTDDPGSWLLQSDALLVPTAIPLGIRVRIVTALSYGTPVVTHRSNALGIPELRDGENALLGGRPSELAAAAARLVRDDGLRARIEREARATYERWFAPQVAAAAIVGMLEGAMG